MAWNPDTGVSAASPDRSLPESSDSPRRGSRACPGPASSSAHRGRKRPASRRWERQAHPDPRCPAHGHRERPAGRTRGRPAQVAGSVRPIRAQDIWRPGDGRVRRWLPVSALGHRVRQWLSRKGGDVGFRGGRDEFRERPAAVGRGIFREGVIRVFRGGFRLPRAGIRVQAAPPLPVPRKGHRAARRLRNGGKTLPRGNGMPVIASPHRSPLSVPALPRPARSPILGHFGPDRRRVDQGVIRLPAGDGVRSPAAHAARTRAAG